MKKTPTNFICLSQQFCTLKLSFMGTINKYTSELCCIGKTILQTFFLPFLPKKKSTRIKLVSAKKMNKKPVAAKNPMKCYERSEHHKTCQSLLLLTIDFQVSVHPKEGGLLLAWKTFIKIP